MRHEQVRDALAEWALDLLASDDRLTVDDHLEGCGLCSMEADLYRQGVSALVTLAVEHPAALSIDPVPPLPVGGTARIQARVREELGLAPAGAAADLLDEPPRRRWFQRGSAETTPAGLTGIASPAADEEDEFGTDILSLDALLGIGKPPEPAPDPLAAFLEPAGVPELVAPDDGPPGSQPAAAGMVGPLAEAAADGPASEPEALRPDRRDPLADLLGIPVREAERQRPAARAREPEPSFDPPDDDDDFSTEGLFDDLLGRARRFVPRRSSTPSAGRRGRAAVADLPGVIPIEDDPDPATYPEEFAQFEPQTGQVGSGWRFTAIFFALISVGLFAGLVAGFFVLVDYRNRADVLEQKQASYAASFGFTGESIQGSVYLLPPNYQRGMARIDLLEPIGDDRQLVLWAATEEGPFLVQPLFRNNANESRIYVELVRMPVRFTRLYLTNERAPFTRQQPQGEEVASAVPPFDLYTE